MEFDEFQAEFKRLTGYIPLSWQWRLYRDYFSIEDLPAGIDLPTGLGKTAVIALWLIAIRNGQRLPRRLVYVVDRRAVVDQATEFVEAMRNRVPHSERIPVSTLRGQHADNREWLDDPGRPAIIVGTVDMIGSRLLFEGYGVSRKMRPYHAGLLGCDALVVLDESHLVPPFECLLERIEDGDREFGPSDGKRPAFLPRLYLLPLSATGREREGKVFRLAEPDLDESHLPRPLTRVRLGARKILTVVDIKVAERDSKKREKKLREELTRQLADQAWNLTKEGALPTRCLIYCDSRDQAEKIHAGIVDHIKAASLAEHGNPADAVDLFIGARRGHERAAAAAQLDAMGFLASSTIQFETARFLVATSAGEVGVDLDADHMVCDLVAWERMVQRLGRVNRRGGGEARVVVLDSGPRQTKNVTEAEAERAETVHRCTRALIDSLPVRIDGFDASPDALNRMKTDADSDRRQQIMDATTPAPLRPALTRALLDAWSMTGLREHTGRPEVAPWLRGWVRDDPQTTVIWRRFLPVRKSSSNNTRRWQGEVEAYFEAAPLHIAELLETETHRVVEWAVKRARNLSKHGRTAGSSASNQSPASVIAIALTSAGDFAQAYSQEDFETPDKKGMIRELAGKTLILDAGFGGCTTQGTLNADVDGPYWLGDDDQSWPEDERDPEIRVIRWRVRRLDDEQQTEFEAGWLERFRFKLEVSDDGDVTSALVVYKWRHDTANEEDRAIGRNQTLDEHQAWAAQRARDLGNRLGLPDEYINILVIAARLHDEGKKAQRWQRAFHAPAGSEPLAKTKGPLNVALLDGYRHEFGSLFHAERDSQFQALSKEHQELVLHLIAAHHGNARPIISVRGCEEAPPSVLEANAREVALRFARLQRQWGPWGLAWWEALLRAADQQASKQNDLLLSTGKSEHK